MKKIDNIFENKINNDDLKIEFFKSKKENPDYKKFVDNINLNDEYLMKYNSSLKQCFLENNNCINCKGLDDCKNEVKGCIYSCKVVDGQLIFNYRTCKYKNNILKDIEYIKNSYSIGVSKDVRNAKLKDIYTNDKNRVEVIKWITNFIKDYKQNKNVKGLYLSGNFGSGKSYIVSALINELVKDNKKGAIIYYPEFLRSLKASFSSDFDELYNDVKCADLLLLDDIGAENVTPWSRDEILGPIIQYRMEEGLPTFFTSNLTLEELEMHLSMESKKIEKLKAKRLIEKISYMCDEIKLISKNNRK